LVERGLFVCEGPASGWSSGSMSALLRFTPADDEPAWAWTAVGLGAKSMSRSSGESAMKDESSIGKEGLSTDLSANECGRP